MRRIRVVIGTLGMDQHELAAVAVARVLRDAGVEVIYLGRFQTPESLVRVAIDEDADVIGISVHSWEYIDYTPELMELLKRQAPDVAVVIGGSIITQEDARRLEDLGVAAVFGAGSADSDIIAAINRLGTARHAPEATD